MCLAAWSLLVFFFGFIRQISIRWLWNTQFDTIKRSDAALGILYFYPYGMKLPSSIRKISFVWKSPKYKLISLVDANTSVDDRRTKDVVQTTIAGQKVMKKQGLFLFLFIYLFSTNKKRGSESLYHIWSPEGVNRDWSRHVLQSFIFKRWTSFKRVPLFWRYPQPEQYWF